MKRNDVVKKIQRLYELELELYPKYNPSDLFAENLLTHLELMNVITNVEDDIDDPDDPDNYCGAV